LGAFLEAELGVASYPTCQGLILGGHSLGAMTALKALDLPEFSAINKVAVCIGLGLNVKAETHNFDTTFYQKTLSTRRQLVSPAIDSSLVFPWIRDEKVNLKTTGQRVHLITGEDDAVVGPGGLQLMVDKLISLGNEVTFYEPKRLPHHEPSQASPHIFSFLKGQTEKGAPVNAILLQTFISVTIILLFDFRMILQYIELTLSLFCLLTVAGVFIIRARKLGDDSISDRRERVFGSPTMNISFIIPVPSSIISFCLLASFQPL
jgi:hypothetical protein